MKIEQTVHALMAKYGFAKANGGAVLTSTPPETRLMLDRVPIPKKVECEHFFFCGRPGVGKTVAMSQIISQIEEIDGKAIIYDFKGDYVQRFYQPGRDLIFNPLDIRSVGWSLFNEVSTVMDIDAIAHSLIPPAQQNDPFWNDAARDVFSGILRYLFLCGRTKNSDIWELASSPISVISELLAGTPGAERGYVYIQDASGKMALSVHAVMMQFAKAFEFMTDADGSFSIKSWLEDGKPGFIFITSYADIKDTLKPILSLFVDLLGRKLLSMKDDRSRRVFFMLDEFGTLQKLSSIVQLLTLSRSKGGSTWIGIQDMGQIEKIYGKELRQTIFNACGTSLLFAVKDPDTQKFFSDAIGDTRYIDSEETRQMGSADERDGITLIRRRVTEKLILPSDLQNLPALQAYLKIPGYSIAKIKLHITDYADGGEPFVLNQKFSLANILAAIKKAEAEAEASDQNNKQQLRDKLKRKEDKEITEEEGGSKDVDDEGDLIAIND